MVQILTLSVDHPVAGCHHPGMSIQVHTVPAFDDNYIWLIGRSDHRGVTAVDPGDADPVLDYLDRHDLTLEAIVITHHHYDHTGGIAELLTRFEVPVYAPANEKVPGRSHAVSGGDRIELSAGALTLEVLDSPGHTRGHVCYVGEGALFCGDTLFTAGCGRIFEGTAEQLYRSLDTLRQLPDETMVYCAHEYTEANLAFARTALPDDAAIAERQRSVAERRRNNLPTVPERLAVEKATNPFLRYDDTTLITAAERFAGHSLTSPAEVFATVRHWKDTLD